MRAVFDHRSDEAPNITTFYFRPETALKYTAGQFVEVTLHHVASDQRGHKRWFTLSSSPTDELVSITTRFTPEKGSTFKKALWRLQTGEVVTMSEALGDFVLPQLLQTPLVFVASGMGITPFHSMLSWLTATNEQRPITMLYAVSSEDEIIFQDTLYKAKQHATLIVKNPSAAWGGERGPLTAELVMGIAQPSAESLVYLSGPEGQIEKLSKDLIRAGLKKHQLVLDLFPNYQS